MSTKLEITKIIYEADYLSTKQKVELIKNINEGFLNKATNFVSKKLRKVSPEEKKLALIKRAKELRFAGYRNIPRPV